ncbi:MAGE-like protein 2 [Kryptolebias marmoratus]|uniref:MAGE-like protein 2 n=1 Tax=Kryptolebias marmoratus TaxID=37003 RepID=UPI0018ACCDD3|nr:MAGE-like protein 2 [Kryptolebias marmoratus]
MVTGQKQAEDEQEPDGTLVRILLDSSKTQTSTSALHQRTKDSKKRFYFLFLRLRKCPSAEHSEGSGFGWDLLPDHDAPRRTSGGGSGPRRQAVPPQVARSPPLVPQGDPGLRSALVRVLALPERSGSGPQEHPVRLLHGRQEQEDPAEAGNDSSQVEKSGCRGCCWEMRGSSRLLQAPSGSFRLLQAPPSSSRFLQAPPGSSRLLQAPPGSSRLLQAPPGSFMLLHAPPCSSRFLQAPPGSSRLLQAPSCSFMLLHAPPGSSRLLQAPSGSFRLLQAPPGSFRLLQAPPGSSRLLHAPSCSSMLLQVPPGSSRLLQAPPGSSRLLQALPGLAAWEAVGGFCGSGGLRLPARCPGAQIPEPAATDVGPSVEAAVEGGCAPLGGRSDQELPGNRSASLGLAAERIRLEKLGLPQNVVRTIQGARAASTTALYTSNS